jgi:hypothetical protein
LRIQNIERNWNNNIEDPEYRGMGTIIERFQNIEEYEQ